MVKTASVSAEFLQSSVDTLFISDSHLMHKDNGAAKEHLKTLYYSNANTIMSVGDTIDFEYIIHAFLKKSKLIKKTQRLHPDKLALEKLPRNFETILELLGKKKLEHHMRIFDVLMQKVSQGKEVILFSGNHDIGLEKLDGQTIEGISIKKEELRDFGDAGKALILHGQYYDPGFLQKYSGLYGIGSRCLDVGLAIDKSLQILPALSEQYHISNFMKVLGKGYVKKFRKAATAGAFEAGADAAIVGHIHNPDNRKVKIKLSNGEKPRTADGKREKKQYLNIGDGQTHGTSLILTKNKKWININAKAILDTDAKDILGEINPVEHHREQSLQIIQKFWERELENLETTFDIMKNQQHIDSLEIAVA